MHILFRYCHSSADLDWRLTSFYWRLCELQRDFVKGDKFIDRVVFGLLDDHQAAVKADPYSKPLRLAIGAEPNINQSAVEHEEPEQQHFLPAKLSNGSNGMTTNAIVQSDEADKENASTLNVANGSQTGVSSADGTKPLNDGKLTHVPEIRKGVQPGSFIDLLVRGSMRDTGELFTHNEKAQQASPHTQCRHQDINVQHSPIMDAHVQGLVRTDRSACMRLLGAGYPVSTGFRVLRRGPKSTITRVYW